MTQVQVPPQTFLTAGLWMGGDSFRHSACWHSAREAAPGASSPEGE